MANGNNGNGVWKWVAGVLGVVLVAGASAWGTHIMGQLATLNTKVDKIGSDFREFRGEVRAKLERIEDDK